MPEATIRAENVEPVRALLCAGAELLAAVELCNASELLPYAIVDAAATMRALVDEWVVLDKDA